MLGTIIGAGLQAGLGALNNYWAEEQQQKARAENYRYGEMAANNADKRTRALYGDFYSPQALQNQYRQAGLSPSLMYGGTPGQGGMSGAQGSGANGPGALYTPMSMMEGAQIANLMAQTDKTKAETRNIEKDTDLKRIEEAMNNLNLQQYQNEWEILNSTWKDNNGNETSIFEAARDHYSYDSFLNWCRDGNTDEVIKRAASTETGQKVLRGIFQAANQFHRDLMVLSEQSVSAEFQLAIVQKLQDKNFAELNASAAVQQLRAMNAANELTETQKEAWNNLIDKLGKKGSTMRDIVVVLGMILGNFASHTGIKLNLGGR